jgi:aminoglycoside/choline kinase family phosphotransferase
MTTSTSAPASPDLPAAVGWADPARCAAFTAWLQGISTEQSLRADSLRLASADASFRRYLRIDTQDGGSRIIMDAPPSQENCEPFVRVAQLMQAAGLRVPQVLSWDAPQGFMLLSDLGAQTMMQLLQQGDTERVPQRGELAHDLYLAAVDALIRWQLASRPEALPPYDEALLTRELDLFPQWYVARHRGLTLSDAQQQQLVELFAQIRQHNLQALGGARVFVHRDFMPRNLMVDPLDPRQRLAVLDFQDAVYGPISYDIASLMRDAFLSWDEEFVLDITVRYWQQARKAGLPVGDDFGEFYAAVEWMGLQRHLKILGIFARLTLRDGKPQYLADTPRFVAYVRSTASRYRQLAPLMHLLEQIEGGATQVGYTF